MNTPIVNVEQGTIKGFIAKNVDGGKYLAFQGIPYAEPPVGDLRWKDPRPPTTWDGIRDAAEVPPKAPQYDLMTGITTGSEDCLYLYVATNSLIGKRPVMVWIHGGAFVMGSPSNEMYGPDYLVKRNIVLVKVAYRLGCFGFLNLNLPDAAGNQGLKDQLAALKWVRKNIHAFGGDPENVTLFGQSAGAACVHCLALSPHAQGLFHNVILQSGVVNNPWAYEANPLRVALKFTELAKKKTDDPEEALEYLRSLSSTQLIEAQKKMNARSIGLDLNFNFVMSIDGKSPEPIMLETPEDIIKSGINVPLIIGFTTHEGLLALPDIATHSVRNTTVDLVSDLANDFRIEEIDRVADAAKKVEKFYFGDEPMSFKTHENEYVQMKGDVLWVNGIQKIVDIQSEKSTPTYLYRFAYRPSYTTFRTYSKCTVEGSCHGDELGALFHSHLLMGNQPHENGTSDRMIMKRLTRMWSNFAATGNPTPPEDDIISYKWERVTKDERNHLEISDKVKPGVNAGEASWKFWKPILETLQSRES